MATSGTNAPQDERPSLSDMSPDERAAAMDMRTLPTGETIGRKPAGVQHTWDDLPDLIAAKYGGGKVGYVRKIDIFESAASPGEEAAGKVERTTTQRLREGPRKIPVFAENGQTVIGEKEVGGDVAVEELKDGTTVTYDFDKAPSRPWHRTGRRPSRTCANNS
jgi:hypothetical protein